MKGVVFTEFLEMVEERYSADVVDDIIDSCELSTGGVYTAVGTYPPAEMTALVTALSEQVGSPVPDLLSAYGEFLFGRFTELYPQFLSGPDDVLDFLSRIEDVIHSEVRKLYPDAELPSFDVSWPQPDVLQLEYRSPRRLGDLADGLIHGAIAHFGKPVDLVREDLDGVGDGSDPVVRFTLTRRPQAAS